MPHILTQTHTHLLHAQLSALSSVSSGVRTDQQSASVANIVYLFSKEFTILIIISFVLSAPLAWYLMSNWLNNFAYRIPLGAGVFVLAMLLSVIIAWITVGYKSVRAAMVNPVKSLKSE